MPGAHRSTPDNASNARRGFLPSAIDAIVGHRQGTAAEIDAIILADGELAIATDKGLRRGNNAALGGFDCYPYTIIPSGTGLMGGVRTGNTRGLGAIDIQGARSSSSQVASGDYSVAYGANCTASGASSTAIGETATASGSRSAAVGYFVTASGTRALALGATVTVSGTNATGVGYGITNTIDNTAEFGYWSGGARSGAIRTDSTGQVQHSVRNSASPPTDGGATAGSEAAGALGRSCWAIQRNGLAFTLYYNDAGTVKSYSLGTLA